MSKAELKKWAEDTEINLMAEENYHKQINWDNISEKHLEFDFLKEYINFEDGETDLDLIHVAMFELIEWAVINRKLTKYQVGLLLTVIQKACFELNELELKLSKTNQLNHFENGHLPVYARLTSIIDTEKGYSFDFETIRIIDNKGNRETSQCCYSEVECF